MGTYLGKILLESLVLKICLSFHISVEKIDYPINGLGQVGVAIWQKKLHLYLTIYTNVYSRCMCVCVFSPL